MDPCAKGSGPVLADGYTEVGGDSDRIVVLNVPVGWGQLTVGLTAGALIGSQWHLRRLRSSWLHLSRSSIESHRRYGASAN